MEILLMLAAVIAPAIGLFLFTKFVLKKLLPFIDRQAAFVQQLIMLVEGFLFTKLSVLLHIPQLPLDIHGWTADTVSSVVYGGLALAIHAVYKTNSAGATRLPSSASIK